MTRSNFTVTSFRLRIRPNRPTGGFTPKSVMRRGTLPRAFTVPSAVRSVEICAFTARSTPATSSVPSGPSKTATIREGAAGSDALSAV
jgi:hypothetical protein